MFALITALRNMQDPQNYQYYDPSPQAAPVSPWKQPKIWIRLGLGLVVVVGLIFLSVAVVNILKNRKLANQENSVMGQADSIESQLASKCKADDTNCLDQARADAARSLGVSQVCGELKEAALANCVTLIAQDHKDAEVCKELSGADKSDCQDSVYLRLANDELKLATCDQIEAATTKSACRSQVSAKLVLQGRCEDAGADVSECQAADALSVAIQAGTAQACLALPTELQRYDCDRAINSIDEDHDQLVLIDEVRLSLSDANFDSDADGLSDGDEVHQYKTDPAKADTDGDGYADGLEVNGGYDPLK